MPNHYMHIPSVLQIVELTQIMRQTDQDFIEMLNKAWKGFQSMKTDVVCLFFDFDLRSIRCYFFNLFGSQQKSISISVFLPSISERSY